MVPPACGNRKGLAAQCKGHSQRPALVEQCKGLLRDCVRHLGRAVIFALSTGFLLFCLVAAKVLLLVYTSELHSSAERQEIDGTYQDPSHSRVTWTLVWAVCAPFLLTFLARVAKVKQQNGQRLSGPQFILALAGAVAQTVSLSLMVFRVLPSLDIFRGFFATLAFGAASSIIHTLLNGKRSGRFTSRNVSPFAVGALLVVGHVVGWLVFAGRWSSSDSLESASTGSHVWQLPAAIFSVFLEKIAYLLMGTSSDGCCLLTKRQKNSNRSRYRILPLLVEPCKVGLLIAFAVVLSGEGRAQATAANTQLSSEFLPRGNNYKRPSPVSERPVMSREGELWSVMAYLKDYSSATFVLIPLAFAFAARKFARVHPVALNISSALASPLSLITLIVFFLQRQGVEPVAAVKDAYPVPRNYELCMYSLGFLPLWLFQLWLLWKQKSESRAQVQDNFLLLLSKYFAVIPESTALEHAQELGMIRNVTSAAAVLPDAAVKETLSRSASNPMVYVCATVWHEQQHEMLRMLASIVRLDEDQARRRHAQFMLSEIYQSAACKDPNFYTFEAHVFIDDAMELMDDQEWTINSYTTSFVKTVDLAVSEVFGPSMKLRAPLKCNTPYGGRLVWTLPGGNKMFVHLKDKRKVRIRKRWSQIMYMHYLFEYRRFEQESVVDEFIGTGDVLRDETLTSKFADQLRFAYLENDVQINHSLARDEDIYFLAVDGDVDFRPDDVLRLVDCLKRDSRIGVACGRIHPIGTGPVVWYQQFEYAFSHWLQKSAEQVLGCVLCAPGAFSLFRASALMNDGVADAYASLASEARHHVQYEQGEDRWLTALLMRRAYRVEYVPDAVALSHAPESLAEFFSQRRRWNPSTVAHTVDFLVNWRKMKSSHDDITAIFVIYQAVVFSTWLLAPASITALVAGGLNTIFEIQLEMSFLLAFTIPASYAVVCFTASQTAQVNFAAMMNGASIFLMAALVVTLLPNVSEVGLTSFWGLFSLLEVTVFTTAAALHPKEFACLLHGVLYYLCIVTGYVLLIIYSVANLHLVSWGTREEQSRRIAMTKGSYSATGNQGALGHAKQDLSHNNNELPGKNRYNAPIEMEANQYGFQSSHEGEQRTPLNFVSLASRDQVQESHEHINVKNSTISERGSQAVHASCRLDSKMASKTAGAQEDLRISESPHLLRFTTKASPSVEYFTFAPWMNERCLLHAPTVQLSDNEMQYWNSIMSGLLQPLPQDTAREARMEANLRSLRNLVCCIFFGANTIWMTVIYCLQSTALIADLWSGLRADDIDDTSLTGDTDNPVFLVMLSISAAVLTAQYICMLQHRFKDVVNWFDGAPFPARWFASIEQQQLTVGHLKFKLPLHWCEHVAAQALADALAVVRTFHYGHDSYKDNKGCNKKITLATKIWRKLHCAKKESIAMCSHLREPMFVEMAGQQQDFELRKRFTDSMWLLRKPQILCEDTGISHYKKDGLTFILPLPSLGIPWQCDPLQVAHYKSIQDPCWSKSLGQLPALTSFAPVTVER